MIKKLLFMAAILGSIQVSTAQFSLGDIAFSAYNSETASNLPPGTNVDSFTIVLLRAVTAGEQLEFTENGWFAAGGFRSGENTATLTFGSNYPVGTQIAISADPFVALDQDSNSAGTLTGNGLSLATGGDQIFAYDPANIPSAGNESGFVAAMHMNGDWDADSTSSTTSSQPSVFTDGVNSISINPEVDNGRFAPAGCASFPTVALLRAGLNDSANWETNNSTGYTHLPPACDFTSTLSLEGQTNLERAIDLYPNPMKNELNIRLLTEVNLSKVTIIDLNGRTIVQLNDNFDRPIDVSSLSSGVYLVQMEANNRVVTKKLVKN